MGQMRRTHVEQIRSALPPRTDFAQIGRNFADRPKAALDAQRDRGQLTSRKGTSRRAGRRSGTGQQATSQARSDMKGGGGLIESGAMLKTYQGSCHCGKTKFEVDADLDHVRVCDCSICRRRGALLHRVEAHRLRVLTPDRRLGNLFVQYAHRQGLFLQDVWDIAIQAAADRTRVMVSQYSMPARRRSGCHPDQIRLRKPPLVDSPQATAVQDLC